MRIEKTKKRCRLPNELILDFIFIWIIKCFLGAPFPNFTRHFPSYSFSQLYSITNKFIKYDFISIYQSSASDIKTKIAKGKICQ